MVWLVLGLGPPPPPAVGMGGCEVVSPATINVLGGGVEGGGVDAAEEVVEGEVDFSVVDEVLEDETGRRWSLGMGSFVWEGLGEDRVWNGAALSGRASMTPAD